MYDQIIKRLRPNLDKTIEKVKQEIAILRTGQASPALVENVLVECYNSKMSLRQIAAINVKDVRTLIIQPWDKAIIKNIEKAIIDSAPGLSIAIDGDLIRINLPSPTEETRKELIRALHQKLEEGRISVRQIREDAWKEIQELTQAGKIREDDKFRGKDELQKVIDEYNNKIKEIGGKKEKEILAI